MPVAAPIWHHQCHIMEPLLIDWPYFGLALAATLLAIAWRAPVTGPRWHDPVFVLRLLWPMYLVHQFEEHGVDLLGRPYAFLGELCATLGRPALADCPADPAFIFSVNVVACWVAFAMPLVWARRRPLLAAFGWSIPLVNGATHIASSLVRGGYNPGVLTSVVLFLPLCAWMVKVLRARGILHTAQLPFLVAAGVAVHAVLIGSLLAHERGLIGHAALLVINALNGLVPVAVGLLVERRAAGRSATPAVA